MKTSYIVAGIVIIVVAVIVGFISFGNRGIPQYAPPTPQAPASPTAQSQPTSNATLPSSITVTYTDSGFSPSIVTIPRGSTVLFKNSASDALWVGSNPHPIHNEYPTTGGCIGSTFDSCRGIAPGSSWSFTFNLAGRWGYHNHLNPGEGGTVIVQ